MTTSLTPLRVMPNVSASSFSMPLSTIDSNLSRGLFPIAISFPANCLPGRCHSSFLCTYSVQQLTDLGHQNTQTLSKYVLFLRNSHFCTRPRHHIHLILSPIHHIYPCVFVMQPCMIIIFIVVFPFTVLVFINLCVPCAGMPRQ